MQTEGLAPQNDPCTPDDAAQQERARIKDAILHELPHADRLLLVLWHAEGMNVQEISAVLSMPEAEVRATHDRIVAQLSAALVPVRASA
jgi:DNA-directed RNA polymerase specialized sigma24 family protein